MYPAIMQPTNARIEQIPTDVHDRTPGSRVFPPIQPIIPRNFLVADTVMETPPSGISPAAYEVPFRTAPADYKVSYQGDFLAPFRGLHAVSKEIRDLLPEECRKHFDEAVGREDEWFSRWGDERDTKSRREPLIDKHIVPVPVMPSRE